MNEKSYKELAVGVLKQALRDLRMSKYKHYYRTAYSFVFSTGGLNFSYADSFLIDYLDITPGQLKAMGKEVLKHKLPKPYKKSYIDKKSYIAYLKDTF